MQHQHHPTVDGVVGRPYLKTLSQHPEPNSRSLAPFLQSEPNLVKASRRRSL
ncbi:hypothetical protein SynPROSU1_01934 [Synechococcus sp. PROS-U-1]|nr:hypothetical protein SynPROSU1_01934 [Synechococcus sp. PROS-U-1]